jgi:hypothetical protein
MAVTTHVKRPVQEARHAFGWYPLVKAIGTKEGPSLNDKGPFPKDVRVQWRNEVR